MAYENKGAMTATIVVAASDSLNKAAANYVCDGTADNVEIQAAIDALPVGGGKVVLLDGNYSIAAIIQVDSYVTIEGQGWNTILKIANGADLAAIFAGTFKTDVIYKDMQLDGNGDNQAGPNIATLISASGGQRVSAINILAHGCVRSGIYWGDTKDCSIINCIAYDNGRDVLASSQGFGFGLSASAEGATARCVFSNCHTWSNIEGGFSLYGNVEGTGPIDCDIIGCTSEDETVAAINLLYCTNCSVIGCEVTNAVAVGIQLIACKHCIISSNRFYKIGSFTIYIVGSCRNTFANNYVYRGGQVGISIDVNSHENVISGNNLFEVVLYSGIWVKGKNNSITGNICNRSSRDGIRVEGDFNIISSNICLNNSQRAVNTDSGIVLVNGADHNTCLGNICSDDQNLDTSLLTDDAASGQKVVNVASTASFRPGQWVTISDTTPLTENNQIDTVDSATQLTMKNNLTNTYTVANAGVVTGRHTQKYGIYVEAGSDYNTFGRNVINGNVTFGIYDLGSSNKSYDRQIQSDKLDLSGAATDVEGFFATCPCYLVGYQLLYTEASSADAGVNIRIGRYQNGVALDDDYFDISVSEVSKNLGYSKAFIGSDLTQKVIAAGDTVTVGTAGGKAGTGEVMIVLHIAEMAD
ncbi:MAG: right-handed parallel beta-helix repeat-containing protein [Sphaerochaeta sp.]|jgi:parallel beta-helix repeat protein|nr:right-handed parallel beta-helix repeat-containing protein [Sphaerochaeta sp.]